MKKHFAKIDLINRAVEETLRKGVALDKVCEEIGKRIIFAPKSNLSLEFAPRFGSETGTLWIRGDSVGIAFYLDMLERRCVENHVVGAVKNIVSAKNWKNFFAGIEI